MGWGLRSLRRHIGRRGKNGSMRPRSGKSFLEKLWICFRPRFAESQVLSGELLPRHSLGSTSTGTIGRKASEEYMMGFTSNRSGLDGYIERLKTPATKDETKWTEIMVQYALTRPGCLFDFRRNVSVPNVSWGWGLSHEADLVCVTLSGTTSEIEVKVSMEDLRADKNKPYGHKSKKIKHLWFAIPNTLDEKEALREIPERAGLVVVSMRRISNGKMKYFTRVSRRPRVNKAEYVKPDVEQINRLLRLGVMRMWSDKRKWKEFE